LIRYGELELPRGAIAQLVLALKETGDNRLAYELGRAIDGNASELRLTPNDYAPILRALEHTPIPELADFSRVLEGRSRTRRPTSEEIATLREKRMAANEAFFRELNEKLERQAPDSGTLIIVCECADEDCVKRLELTRHEYEAIRSDPTHFAIAHEHADLEIEEVISRTDRFEVVRKLGAGADIAARLDSTSEDRSDPLRLERQGQ
jgi:hypothetical protein